MAEAAMDRTRHPLQPAVQSSEWQPSGKCSHVAVVERDSERDSDSDSDSDLIVLVTVVVLPAPAFLPLCIIDGPVHTSKRYRLPGTGSRFGGCCKRC